MQAIRTTYKGPTNTRPSKMHAICQAGHITVSYEPGVDIGENHRRACEALRAKLGWLETRGYPPMVSGDFAGDTFWVFKERSVQTHN